MTTPTIGPGQDTPMYQSVASENTEPFNDLSDIYKRATQHIVVSEETMRPRILANTSWGGLNGPLATSIIQAIQSKNALQLQSALAMLKPQEIETLAPKPIFYEAGKWGDQQVLALLFLRFSSFPKEKTLPHLLVGAAEVDNQDFVRSLLCSPDLNDRILLEAWDVFVYSSNFLNLFKNGIVLERLIIALLKKLPVGSRSLDAQSKLLMFLRRVPDSLRHSAICIGIREVPNHSVQLLELLFGHNVPWLNPANLKEVLEIIAGHQSRFLLPLLGAFKTFYPPDHVDDLVMLLPNATHGVFYKDLFASLFHLGKKPEIATWVLAIKECVRVKNLDMLKFLGSYARVPTFISPFKLPRQFIDWMWPPHSEPNQKAIELLPHFFLDTVIGTSLMNEAWMEAFYYSTAFDKTAPFALPIKTLLQPRIVKQLSVQKVSEAFMELNTLQKFNEIDELLLPSVLEKMSSQQLWKLLLHPLLEQLRSGTLNGIEREQCVALHAKIRAVQALKEKASQDF